MPRKVLLTYMDVNKGLILPDDTEICDIDHLKLECIKAFSLDSQNCKIIFQKYDKDWQEFLFVEEDEILADKTKLKVTVLPTLSANQSTKISQNMYSRPNYTKEDVDVSF